MGKQSLHPEGLFATKDYSFSHVVSVEGKKMIFCSGQASRGLDGSVIGKGDLGLQMRTTMESIKIALAEAGATLDDICRIKVYVVNLSTDMLGTIGEVTKAAFDRENLPAETLIGVQGLADPDLMVEIEATAVID